MCWHIEIVKGAKFYLVTHVHTFAFEMRVPWLFAYAVMLLNTRTLCPRNWSPLIGHK